MAKYAISQEGADEMLKLSSTLKGIISNLEDANRSLRHKISGNMDELGVYGTEIWGLTMHMLDILSYGKDSINALAEHFSKQAYDIIAIMNSSIADTVTTGIDSSSTKSSQYNDVISAISKNQIQYNEIKPFGRRRSTEEIVSRISGGDLTEGSCSSLAFAYAGNKAGFDVLDFRDGDSREFFSKNSSIQMVANLPGVNSKVVYHKDDFAATKQLLQSMENNKEYYLATGLHAAIIRKDGDHYEFLELQSSTPSRNGWHHLDDYELFNRFGCSDSNTFQIPNFLIDVESLSNCQEFLNILGYINTSEINQRKGDSGHVR